MKFNREDMSESKWFGFLQKYWLYIVVVIAVIIVAVSSINIYREEVLEIDPDVKMEEQKHSFLCFRIYRHAEPYSIEIRRYLLHLQTYL